MLAEGGSARAKGPILRAAGLVRAAELVSAAELVRTAGLAQKVGSWYSGAVTGSHACSFSFFGSQGAV